MTTLYSQSIGVKSLGEENRHLTQCRLIWKPYTYRQLLSAQIERFLIRLTFDQKSFLSLGQSWTTLV